MTRLIIQHELSIEVHAGRLYLAPVTNPRRVLDIGTGSGEWALDFGKNTLSHLLPSDCTTPSFRASKLILSGKARQNPASSVLGVDLVAVKAPPTEPNCSFCIGDVEEDWQFASGKFDYIYARSLARKFSNTRRYMASVYANLNPGGFVEFQEWVTELRSANNSLDGTALQKWNRGMLQGSPPHLTVYFSEEPMLTLQLAMKQIGQELDFINGYPPMLEKAGFVNITERRYPVPVTCWAPGKRLQKIGGLMRQKHSYTIFGGVLGWSKEDLQILVRDVKSDLQNNNIHCFAVL
ncbi:TAM domain methyltransferase [Apiospora kogelbergensis]|uniref:TAM domain methyltransferase n=1 Tax=Apiospora kogelbergensis TaxID=1337665 RepID=UPI00312FA354